MIYIVFSKREELLIHRIGVKEIQQYAHLKDFVPFLHERGTVVTVRDAQREIKPIYKLLQYLGQPCVYLFFSPPDGPYSRIACPKIFIAPIDKDAAHPISEEGIRKSVAGITFSQEALETLEVEGSEEVLLKCIPPPIWDKFQHLHDPQHIDQSSLFTVRTNGNILDTDIPSLQPDRITFNIPLTSRLHSIISAAIYYKTDIYGLRQHIGKRRQDRYFATDIELSKIVYTAVINPKHLHKDWRNLILTFAKTFVANPDATLVIKMVGVVSHKIRRAAIKLLRKLSVQCRIIVIFCHLSEDQYKSLIQATTYVINASANQEFGSSILEFMSAGKPAIGNNLDRPSLMNQGNAFLTDKLATQLAQSYELAILQPDRYRHMSKNATHTLQSYCSKAAVEPQFHAFMDAVETKLLEEKNDI